jgi:hypothetical protein
MDPSRPKRILDDWAAVASEARRPAAAPRPVVIRSGLPGATLAGASLVVVGIVIAGVLLGRQAPIGDVGSSPSPVTMPSASPSASPTASSSAPADGSCDPAKVSARITLWEGAAGSRIANVELTNGGSEPCTVAAMARPQLVDGRGAVLIDGSTPQPAGSITLAPGEVFKTLVQASNYCGPMPQLPVSVAFVFGDGVRIVAAPFSATDDTLPPCNGAPSSPGTIEMHPWAR